MIVNQNLEMNAYGELSRAPQTLNDAEVVERHGGEQEFCGVVVAGLSGAKVSHSLSLLNRYPL